MSTKKPQRPPSDRKLQPHYLPHINCFCDLIFNFADTLDPVLDLKFLSVRFLSDDSLIN